MKFRVRTESRVRVGLRVRVGFRVRVGLRVRALRNRHEFGYALVKDFRRSVSPLLSTKVKMEKPKTTRLYLYECMYICTQPSALVCDLS